MIKKLTHQCCYFQWTKLMGWLLLMVPTVGALQAGTLSVSWDSVPDSRVAGYKIKYGTTSGNYTQSLSVGKVTSATLSNLTNGTTYYLVVAAVDSSQVEGIPSSEVSGVVLNASGVSTSSITQNSAVITWQTNKPSDSQVDYGTTTAYGSGSPANSSLVTSHSVTLTGLSASTTYDYQIRSQDAGGSVVVLGNYSFKTTAAADTTPPTISGVASSGVSSNAATISWTTNEASDTQVQYGTTAAYGSSTTLNTALVTSHTASLSGLIASTTYHYRVKSKDAAGNMATSGDFTFATTATPDTTPPTISGVASSGVSSTAVTIAWTTNEASDTQVEYGTTTAYGSSTALNTAMVTAHSTALSGLTASTTYHYRVKSKDAAGNLATSGDLTFATTTTADTTPPGDVRNFIGAASDRKVTLSWTTPSDTDYKGVLIRYRTDGAFPVDRNDGILLVDQIGSPSTSQNFLHTGLTNGTTYYYSAFSYDAAQNYSTTAHTQATPFGLTITSISPTKGPSGTTVVITGTGFGPSQGSSAVTFGGITAPVTAWSDTSISATVPRNVANGAVVVTVNGVQSNSVSFQVSNKLPPPGRIRFKG
jgi:hypothetical protein